MSPKKLYDMASVDLLCAGQNASLWVCTGERWKPRRARHFSKPLPCACYIGSVLLSFGFEEENPAMNRINTQKPPALAAIFLIAAFSILFAAQAKAAENFVKQVLDHEASVTWITYKTPTLPDDVCTSFRCAPGRLQKLPLFLPQLSAVAKSDAPCSSLTRRIRPLLFSSTRCPAVRSISFCSGQMAA